MLDPLKSAERAYESARSRVAEYEAAQAAVIGAEPAVDDFEARLAWKERKAAGAVRLETAKEVAEAQFAKLNKAKAEAKDRADKAAHAAIAREDKAIERLIREMDAANQEQAKRAARLAEYQARRAEANPGELRRFGLIDDPEVRIRHTPERVVPPRFEEQTVYRNAQGQKPSMWMRDPKSGEMVPQELGYHPRRERVQVSGPHTIPAVRPASYADMPIPSLMGGAPLWKGRG